MFINIIFDDWLKQAPAQQRKRGRPRKSLVVPHILRQLPKTIAAIDRLRDAIVNTGKLSGHKTSKNYIGIGQSTIVPFFKFPGTDKGIFGEPELREIEKVYADCIILRPGEEGIVNKDGKRERLSMVGNDTNIGIRHPKSAQTTGIRDNRGRGDNKHLIEPQIAIGWDVTAKIFKIYSVSSFH